jgi:CheY-like chemotaxis protein
VTLPDDEQMRLAHEIMSPLAVIVGYADLLRTRDDEQIRREAPLQIAEAAERLKHAVRALVNGVEETPSPGMLRPDRMPPLRGRSSDQPRRQVLLVDDDSSVRTLLRTTLSTDEYDVLEATDGGTALRLMHASTPALVVLDWQLPVRSGADVLAEIKQHFPGLPVLILTGAHDPEPRRHAEQLRADAFLTKPFSPLELLQAIDRLLGA